MDDTANRILHAAGQIFADKGFQSATIREICALAEVNLASVNYHFRDKETLYFETLKHAEEQMSARYPMPTWEASVSAEQRLYDFVFNMLSRLLNTELAPWQHRLMMREVLQPTAAVRELAERYFRPHFALLNSIVSNLLPPETSDAERHLAALSVIGQCIHQRVGREIIAMMLPPNEAAELNADRLARHITEFSLRGMRGKFK
jgi:TetR/AcrR family transcriptional regulator, regulator of cefoperazone and chloramphenicol sensitivity